VLTTSTGIISLKTLLEMGKFSVPEFQRNYAWESKQLSDFWNDLEFMAQSKERKEEHFFGSVILYHNQETANLEVVDGQQRLTTSFMLISLIRDQIYREDTRVLKTPVQSLDVSIEPNNLLFFDLSDVVPRFSGNQQIREDFLNCVIRTPEDHLREEFRKRDNRGSRKLRKAYGFLKKTLENYVEQFGGKDTQARLRVLHDLYQNFVTGMKVMAITSPSKSEAVSIYMTLNDRGIGLSPSDLVKSILIEYVSKDSKGNGFLNPREVVEKWGEIVENVGEESLDQFLRHYQLVYGWREIKSNKDGDGPNLIKVRERDIFTRFEAQIKGSSNHSASNPRDIAYRILKDLQAKSETYQRFIRFDPVQNNDVIQKEFDLTFRGLASISDSYRIAMLAFFDENLNLEMSELKVWINLVEALSIRWILVGGNAQVLENLFQEIAIYALALRSEKKATEHLNELFNKNFQSDDVISNRLGEPLDDSRLTRYLLFKINENLGGNTRALKFDPKIIHVEHIAPDKMTNQWRTELQIQAHDSEDASSEYDQIVERVGNKTLLEWKINSSIKQKEFAIKKNGVKTKKGKNKGYKDSSILLTTDLLSLPKWSKDSIDQRTAWFTEAFHIIWGKPGKKRVEKYSTWITK